MRMLVSIIMTSLGFLGGLTLAQDTSADEDAIRQLDERWKEAWSNRDAQALAELFAEDADGIDAMGAAVSGRMAIEEHYIQSFENLPPEAGAESEIVSLRFIRPTLAVVDGTWSMTGLPETDEGLPTEGLYTVFVVKRGGQWLYAAGRSRIPVSPPRTE